MVPAVVGLRAGGGVCDEAAFSGGKLSCGIMWEHSDSCERMGKHWRRNPLLT